MSSQYSDDDARTETSKARAQRIEPTYYRRLDPLERTKFRLTLAAFLVGGAWVASGFVFRPQQHSPGTLASVHSNWETQCAACHTAGEPLTAGSYALFGAHEAYGAVKCGQCHAVAGHHARLASAEPACAACHHDHAGADARLTHFADGDCTSCHADLANRVALNPNVPRQSPFSEASIRSFADGHPKFAGLEKDPRRLKFSHSRHLAPGQKLVSGDREAAKKLGDLPERYREQFQEFASGPDQILTLDCSACHTADAPPPAEGGPLAQLDEGAYMRPIRYEQHCAACHSLTFAPVAEKGAKHEVLPHGLPPDQMKGMIRSAVVDRFLAGKSAAAATKSDGPGFPGKTRVAEPAEASAWVLEHFAGAEHMVRDRCVQCHELETLPETSPPDWKIAPTNIPDVWLKWSRFDHRAHRTVTCVGCHERADDPWEPGKPTLDHAGIMIPNHDNCIRCHSPKVGDRESAGVRSDCATCHRYHGMFVEKGTGRPTTPAAPQDAPWSIGRLLDSK